MALGDDILAKYGIKTKGKYKSSDTQSYSGSDSAGNDILAKYGIGGKKKKKTSGVQNLVDIAQQQGLGQQALNIAKGIRRGAGGAFGKLGDLLSRFNYASANVAKEITDEKRSSLWNVAQAAGRGLSGKEKTTYGSLLKERGVGELGRINTPLGPITGRGVLGFIGDVALDPSTYLGGRAIKAGIEAVKKGGEISKLTPLLEKLSTPAREAFGKAFVYGHGVSKGLPENISKILQRMRTAKAGVTESNITRLGNLGKQEEGKVFKALTETRLGEFGARQGKGIATEGLFKKQALNKAKELGASDETINTLKKQLERNTLYAKKAGVQNPYEVYYPFIEADNLKKIEQSTAALKKGSEGYLKQFKAKLKPEDIINSVPEAYARREYQIVRDKITGDSLQFIAKNYGKQFATEKEALKAGYGALKEKGKFGKALGYLKEKDLNFVNNYLNPEFSVVNNLAKASGFDWFNRTWKTAVTKYFPAFHARNFASGALQNYEVIGKDAFNPKVFNNARIILRNMAGKTESQAIKLGSKIYKTKQLAKAFEETFGKGDWRHIADIGDAISDANKINIPGKLKQLASKVDYGRAAGEFVETQQKMVAFIGSLHQGKSIEEALRLAEKAGFDYSKITQFESKVLKRLIPFYTFTRKNLELQGRTLITNPERIANQFKAFRAIGEQPTEEELKGLPDYVKQGFVTKSSRVDKYGRPLFTTAGGTALEQALQQISGNLGMRVASQTNPLLKGLFERATGIDTFRSAGGGKQKLTSEVTKADKYGKFPEFFKKWLGMKPVQRTRFVNGKPAGTFTGYNANPTRLQIMNLLPPSRFINTFSIILDPTMDRRQKLTNLLSGIKEYAVDPEEQKFWNERNTKEALEDLLIKAGVLKKFTTTYIPKK